MGSCLAVEKFEAGSLEAACIHGLPNDPPTHSQTRPLKKLVPFLQTILSVAPVPLSSTGAGLSVGPEARRRFCLHVRLRLVWSWSSSAPVVLSVILFSVCAFFRSRCLK